jgi:hypothetical protein
LLIIKIYDYTKISLMSPFLWGYGGAVMGWSWEFNAYEKIWHLDTKGEGGDGYGKIPLVKGAKNFNFIVILKKWPM